MGVDSTVLLAGRGADHGRCMNVARNVERLDAAPQGGDGPDTRADSPYSAGSNASFVAFAVDTHTAYVTCQTGDERLGGDGLAAPAEGDRRLAPVHMWGRVPVRPDPCDSAPATTCRRRRAASRPTDRHHPRRRRRRQEGDREDRTPGVARTIRHGGGAAGRGHRARSQVRMPLRRAPQITAGSGRISRSLSPSQSATRVRVVPTQLGNRLSST